MAFREFEYEIANADGSVAECGHLRNHFTNDGFNYFMGVNFTGALQRGPWYFGIINNSGYTGVAAGDTITSHAGWTEFITVSEATRRQWAPAAPDADGVVKNILYVEYKPTAALSAKGFFIVDENTLGGSTGLLLATAIRPSPMVVAVGQTLKLIYGKQLKCVGF